MKYKQILDEMFAKMKYVIDLIYNDKRMYKALKDKNLVEPNSDKYYSFHSISGLTLGDYDYLGFGWGDWSEYEKGKFQTREINTNTFLVFGHDAYEAEPLPMELLDMTDEEIINWVVEKEAACVEKLNMQNKIAKQNKVDLLKKQLRELEGE